LEKIICVVAGGEWQVPLISKIQAKGFKVLNINIDSSAKGASLANYFEEADVLDKKLCLAIAQRYELAAVVTDQSDIAVPTVAYIAEKLSLPGIGYQCSLLFTNKLRMRKLAEKLGISCPKYAAVNSFEDAEQQAKNIGYPVVLKPTASQSSRGVCLVKSPDFLKDAFDAARKHSGPKEPVLVEQFIEGTEWTVEGFKSDTKHFSLAVSHKSHYESNPMVASHLTYEPIDAFLKHKELVEQNDRLIEGFKLPFGITHAEYKYENGVYYLIEVAARGGGTKISSHIVPLMAGVDVNDLLIDSILGDIPFAVVADVTGKYSQLCFLDFPPGEVRTMTSENEVTNLPFVVDFKYNFKRGDTLKPIADDRSRHAHVFLESSSENGLLKNLERVKATVHISYE
jgi:biotin carboxylase